MKHRTLIDLIEIQLYFFIISFPQPSLMTLILLAILVPFAQASTEIFSLYIHTDAYATMVKPKILPTACLDILEKKFSGLYNNSLFEDALEGKNCHVPLPHNPLTPLSSLVNTTIRNIPVDDYIASTDVAKMLNEFLDRAFDVRFQWPSGQRVSNALAYTLFANLSYKSACDHIDCRVFRKIVEQTHYQLSVMIARGKARNKFDVLLPIELLGHVVKSLNKSIEERLTIGDGPKIVARRPWCGFPCYGASQTATTAIPSNPLRFEWEANQAKQTLLNFKMIADKKLDQILLFLGRLSVAGNLDRQLKSMQTIVMPEIIGLTRCVSTRPPAVIKDALDNLGQFVFGLLGNIQDAHSPDNWARIFDMARDCVLTLRYTLQFLA